MGGQARPSSLAFAYRLFIPWLLVIQLLTVLPCSGTRPLPAEAKAPSMEINHRQFDDHKHNQQNNERLYQKLQLDLQASEFMGKRAFKPVFTMLPKGPVTPSGPSPIIHNSTGAESTQISTSSVPDQP